MRERYYGTFSGWELHRQRVDSSHIKACVFPRTSLCYVTTQPPLSPLYGFFSSGTPLIRGSLGNRSSTKAMVSAQFAAICCSKRSRSKSSQAENFGLQAAQLLTAVLGVLTSFFSWSSSIFRISLSDMSRAILAAGASQTLLSERRMSTMFSFSD